MNIPVRTTVTYQGEVEVKKLKEFLGIPSNVNNVVFQNGPNWKMLYFDEDVVKYSYHVVEEKA